MDMNSDVAGYRSLETKKKAKQPMPSGKLSIRAKLLQRQLNARRHGQLPLADQIHVQSVVANHVAPGITEHGGNIPNKKKKKIKSKVEEKVPHATSQS